MNLNPFDKLLIKSLSEGCSQKELAVKYKVSQVNINNFLRRARVRNNMLSTIQMVAEARVKKIV